MTRHITNCGSSLCLTNCKQHSFKRCSQQAAKKERVITSCKVYTKSKTSIILKTTGLHSKENKAMSKLSTVKIVPFLIGLAMTINWILFWSVPIMGMGMLWKYCLQFSLMPIYHYIDNHSLTRTFAKNYIYSRPEHSDYFLISVLTLLNSVVFIGIVFYWQLNFGYLPAWLVFVYYCSWVGIGGRIMGTAYSLAHREGHNKGLYKRWIKQSIGNVFENWLGVFFGNVPWNFSTSHIAIHHKLNGGCGDTFYMWDIDRTSLFDFMLFLHRIFLHMSGYSSMKFFIGHGLKDKADPLQRGILTYWLTAATLLVITKSFSFVFWIYFQPLICMTFFLALINVGFHAFIEFDINGKSIPTVNSTCLLGGVDDYFGENDHMAHHHAASVYYRDLPTYYDSKVEDFKATKASVFRDLNPPEFSLFILFGLWDKIAEHFVDYAGDMTKEEIISLLKSRAQRKELEYEEYAKYMDNPTPEMRKYLCSCIEKKYGGTGIITATEVTSGEDKED